MFTGIVEETGVVASFDGSRLEIRCATVLGDATPGSSIAVNGVCLTAVDVQPDRFRADVSPETLRCTNLGDLTAGSIVNLERSLAASCRLSGHIVQGHVDGTGDLVSLESIGNGNWWLVLRVPEDLQRYLVYKGSVALDGISLAIARMQGDTLSVTIIPHTYTNTNLRGRGPGDRINIETDILAKYVERMRAV